MMNILKQYNFDEEHMGYVKSMGKSVTNDELDINQFTIDVNTLPLAYFNCSESKFFFLLKDFFSVDVKQCYFSCIQHRCFGSP